MIGTVGRNVIISRVKKVLKNCIKILIAIFIVAIIYFLTLCFPQPFFRNQVTMGNITLYYDEELPLDETKTILESAESKLKRSAIYRQETHQNVFIIQSPILWTYFTNIYNNVGGINYTIFNHSIFLRKADIKANRLYGPSGKIVSGERTLDYFITHEMTHTLEFQSMDWYKYPIQTNWTLEGYAEYIAYGSVSYEAALDKYLNTPENSGAKYYTRVRTMIAYLLEKENVKVTDLFSKTDEYDSVLKKAIPDDKPAIDDNIGKW